MKYLIYIILAFLLFCTSAYIATAAQTTLTVTVPCTMENYWVSKCVPLEILFSEVVTCENGGEYWLLNEESYKQLIIN